MNRKIQLFIVVVFSVLLLPMVSALAACGIINSAGPQLLTQNIGTGSAVLHNS